MNIKDYLNSATKQIEKIQNQPAILFEKKGGSFGHIYLFEKFGQETVNSIKMSSQITTHYMETNVARQDHWAIAPISYTLTGLVGEVIYTPPESAKLLQRLNINNYLAPLNALSPTFDTYTQSAINTVQYVESSIRRYEQIAKQIFELATKASIKKSNQERVANILRGMRDSRQLVDVYTPFGTYTGLAIQDIAMTQNNTKYRSDLEIQFIEWRDVKTDYREATEEDKSIIARCQKAQEEQLGNASTQPAGEDESTLRWLKNQGVNLFKSAFGGG